MKVGVFLEKLVYHQSCGVLNCLTQIEEVLLNLASDWRGVVCYVLLEEVLFVMYYRHFAGIEF